MSRARGGSEAGSTAGDPSDMLAAMGLGNILGGEGMGDADKVSKKDVDAVVESRTCRCCEG